MIHWRLAPILGALLAAPAFAEPPEPQHDGIELSIWVRNLSSDDKPVRNRAFQSILALGPAAKPALPQILTAIKLLDEEDLNDANVKVVLRVDPSQAGPHIRELLRYNHKRLKTVRELPISALPAEALPHLLDVLKEGEPGERVIAIRVLLEMDALGKRAIPELISLANNTTSSPVRLEALNAVGRMDSTRYRDMIPAIVEAIKEGTVTVSRGVDLIQQNAALAIPLLARELVDPKTPARAPLALALLQFESGVPHVVDNLAHESNSVRLACAAALRAEDSHTPKALLSLLIGLEDNDPAIRINCACCLLNFDSKYERATLSTLIELTDAADPGVRLEAVVRISKFTLDTRRAVPALLQRLDDRDRTVRLRSAESLLRTDRNFASIIVPALVRSFKQGVWTRREEPDLRLATTLARDVGPAALPVLPYLQKYLNTDSRSYSRLPFAIAATRISMAVADLTLPILTEALSSGGDRGPAVRELGRLGPLARPALPEILEVMGDDDSSYRYEAAEAAVRIAPDHSERAMTMLQAGLKKKGDRSEALSALRRLGPLARDSVAELQTLLKSADSHERAAVEEALRHITAK